MKSVTILVILGLFSALASPQGQLCSSSNTFINSASLDVTPYPPVKGSWSMITLTGKATQAFTLQEWDLYWNLNGAIVQQFDEPVTGAYALGGSITVTYNYTVPATATSGYYNLKMLLQNNNGYYMNCWQFSYYLVG